MEDGTLYLELLKLSCVKSEETLDTILCSLWKTRKTGLRGPDKSQLQSLLNFSSSSQLDPVLACLRSLIRKCAYQNFSGDELLKLFPPDLPLDLQSMLLLSFQKNQDRWKEDVSQEQDILPRTSVFYQVRTNAPRSFTPLPSAEMHMPPSLWPRQDDSLAQLNHNDFGISTPLLPDIDISVLPASYPCDTAPAENLVSKEELLNEESTKPPIQRVYARRKKSNKGNHPCLKSMSWTMDNRGSSPADGVAVICLKLHDYSKSPLGETEVKFQLTKDTLEAMLRSMTYISEQLNAVRTSSGPANKKQKQ